MRAIPLLLLPAAFAVLILGCAGDGEQEPLVTGNHENWSRTTTETLDFPVPGHGGGARRIFINPTGETVEPPDSAQEPWDYPDGTIIVKEIYSSSDPPEDVPPDSLTIMVKDRDHPMSRGGWVWITKSPGSDRETIFTEQFCVTCHANANEEHPYGDNNREGQFRDYTFYPYRAEGTVD